MIKGGAFVAIGGPSGVGKDTLIRYANSRLGDDPRFLFVQRTITRATDTASEDHHAVDEASFRRLADTGGFAVAWSAHGLHYGLPREIDDAIAMGRVVIANISRTVLPELQRRYARVVAIAVSADRDLVKDRLTARGREDADTIRQRAERIVPTDDGEWIDLSNSGSIGEAGDALVKLIIAQA